LLARLFGTQLVSGGLLSLGDGAGVNVAGGDAAAALVQ